MFLFVLISIEKFEMYICERRQKMSNVGTTGRIPLWFVGVIGGILVLSVVGLFFYGSYSGLGSSL
jgi:photosystem II PsbJ protein